MSEEDISEIITENNELLQQVEDLESDNDTLKDYNQTLQNDLEDAKKEFRQLEDDYDKLQDANNEYIKDLKEMEQQFKAYKARCEKLEEFIEEHQTEIAELKKKLNIENFYNQFFLSL